MDAEILSNENTGVAIIMPKNSNILEVDKLIKEASKDTPLSRAYKRFEDNFDINCEIGIRNKLNLERWCFSILPKMVGIIEKNKPMATNKKNRKERLEKITKKTDTPMGNLIFGNKVNKL
jgi:hypothetical protein